MFSPRINFFFLSTLAVSLSLFGADIKAVTEDGKAVLLKSDGTWKFVPAENKTTISQTNQISSNAGENESETESDETDLSNDHSMTLQSALVDIVRSEDGFDVRKAKWGMSKAQVKQSESSKVKEESSNRLEYDIEFLEYECVLVYEFSSDKLIRATYVINQPHVDPAEYYKSYENLKKYLTPLYKIPVVNQFDWKNEMYKEDKSKWGFAISIGFLTCKTVWKNSSTQILLNINGGNHLITTNLEYSMLGK